MPRNVVFSVLSVVLVTLPASLVLGPAEALAAPSGEVVVLTLDRVEAGPTPHISISEHCACVAEPAPYAQYGESIDTNGTGLLASGHDVFRFVYSFSLFVAFTLDEVKAGAILSTTSMEQGTYPPPPGTYEYVVFLLDDGRVQYRHSTQHAKNSPPYYSHISHTVLTSDVAIGPGFHTVDVRRDTSTRTVVVRVDGVDVIGGASGVSGTYVEQEDVGWYAIFALGGVRREFNSGPSTNEQLLDASFHEFRLWDTVVAPATLDALRPTGAPESFALRMPVAAPVARQVAVEIDSASLIALGLMRDDCGDLRAVRRGTLELLWHWLESGCGTARTVVWVRDAGGSFDLLSGLPVAASLSSPYPTFSTGMLAFGGQCWAVVCELRNATAADEARALPANICTRGVQKIAFGFVCEGNAAGTNYVDNFYDRYVFLLVPDVSGEWYFGIDSSDGAQLSRARADGVLGDAREILVAAYGKRAFCGCVQAATYMSLQAGQPVWLEFLHAASSGAEAGVLRVAKPGWSSPKVFDLADHPNTLWRDPREFAVGTVTQPKAPIHATRPLLLVTDVAAASDTRDTLFSRAGVAVERSTAIPTDLTRYAGVWVDGGTGDVALLEQHVSAGGNLLLAGPVPEYLCDGRASCFSWKGKYGNGVGWRQAAVDAPFGAPVNAGDCISAYDGGGSGAGYTSWDASRATKVGGWSIPVYGDYASALIAHEAGRVGWISHAHRVSDCPHGDAFLAAVVRWVAGLPDAPTNVTATPAGPREIAVDWHPAPSATGHTVWRRIGDGAVTNVTFLASGSSFVDASLPHGLPITYSVSASTAAGEGQRSAGATAIAYTHATAPDGLVAHRGLGYVAISWSPPADDGASPITAYVVEAGASAGPLDTVAILNATTRAFRDDGLRDGEERAYRVRARNAAGDGDAADVASSALARPGAVRDLVAAPEGSSASLTWAAPADDGGAAVRGYRVWRAMSGSAPQAVATLGAANSSWLDPSTTPGKRDYFVAAFNVVGEGARATATVTVASPSPPDAGALPTTLGEAARALARSGAGPWKSCPSRAGSAWSCSPGSPQPVVALSAGTKHSCVILASGDVDCWGENGQGQSTDHLAGAARSVAAGAAHTCALLDDGTVECWGDAAFGRTRGHHDGDAVAVAAGGSHTCVLLASREVRCFGANTHGQAAGDVRGDVAAIAAGASHTCFLRTDGAVDCVGHNGSGQAADDATGDAVTVAAGGAHTCILTAAGNVRCWGQNARGQALRYDGGDAVQVSAGSVHTCVLKRDGNVFCKGGNRQGESSGYTGGDAVAISAGAYHTLILKRDGSVVGIGRGNAVLDAAQGESYPT